MASKASTRQRRLTQARDWGLILLPALYVIGFVVWSLHFARAGLGFHALPPERYLLAAAVAVLIFGPSAAAEFAFARERMQERSLGYGGKGWAGVKAALVLLPARAVWFYVVFLMLSLVLRLFSIADIEEADVQWTGIGVGLSVAFLIAFLPLLLKLGVLWGHLGTLAERGVRRVLRKPLADDSEDAGHDEADSLPGRSGVVLAVSAWAMLGVLLTGLMFLDDVSPAYGGAQSRHAYLYADPMALPEDVRATFFSDAANATSRFERTVELTVLFHDSGSILAKLRGQDAPKDRLYEISRTHVSGIQWID